MKNKLQTLLFVIFSISFIGAIFYFYNQANLKSSDLKEAPTPSAMPESKSKLPLVAGRQHYTLSNVHHSPNFTDAWIDPELVRPGMEQKMTVHIVDTHPIINVTAKIQSDTKTQIYQLNLVSGTNLDGEWSASWIVNDTHETTYITDFEAKNDIDEIGNAHISWSDPNINCDSCSQNTTCSGGTLSGGADGADGGALIVTGAITIPSGQTLVYGTSLTVNASMAIADGGQIKQGYITMTDADNDNFPAAIAYYYSASATPTAPLRRRSVASGLNCNELDCCDADNDSRPDQTSCFSGSNGCGNFDYDCSGSATACAGCNYAIGPIIYCSDNCSNDYNLAETPTSDNCGEASFINTTNKVCINDQLQCASASITHTVVDTSSMACIIQCQ